VFLRSLIALFEPERRNRFKIPASCHPRLSILFFALRDVDKSHPSIEIVVVNANAFHHHPTNPNVPYVTRDTEDSFYPAGAKNSRCFDGRIVESTLRYSTPYAVVYFATVKGAMTAFVIQGRKAYADGFQLY
jgi:hypothetical protein